MIFLSYSLRGGDLSVADLNEIQKKILEFSKVYIHAANSIDSQSEVIEKLSACKVVLIVNRIRAQESPWVKIEINTAESLGIPVVDINSTLLIHSDSNAIKEYLENQLRTDAMGNPPYGIV